jgi:hypothetical protein
MFPFWLFSALWILIANVSEHSVYSIYIGKRVGTYSPMKLEQTECSGTLAMKLHTPENRPKETYDIQNMAKV